MKTYNIMKACIKIEILYLLYIWTEFRWYKDVREKKSNLEAR